MRLRELLQATWTTLPQSWRAKVPEPLRRRWHRTRPKYEDLPVRLRFPGNAKPGGRQLRIVIFGEFADDWLPAFVNPAVWTPIEGVTEVVRVDDTPRVVIPPAAPGSATVIVPLGPDNIRRCPRGHPSLAPDGRALDALVDKKRFAAYMAAQGLDELCPRTFATDAEAEFPCILKRANLAAGWGIAVARSAEELARLRLEKTWHGKECVVQAFVPSTVEYVTHCVCLDGRILWNCTFACTKQHAEQIRAGMDNQTVGPANASPRTLEQIARALAPLRFSGPCSVDYRLSDAGDIVIFEINPRFGGTLTLPAQAARLSEALACIIDHARLPAPPASP